MRFAIFADVHSNLHALTAVLEDAAAQGATHHVCLGDIVGYNAFPCECVDLIRALDCPVVQGNHDEQASMEITQEGLSPLAEQSLEWTRGRLDEERAAWLRGLRLQRLVRDFTIVHATLDTPQKWGYITTQLDASASFSYQHTGLCFFGHTHVPTVFLRDGSVRAMPFEEIPVHRSQRYLINPGSVGQPRDADWRASYCLYDPAESRIVLRRVPYDVHAAQDAILSAGLPEKLAVRLSLGR